jgi:hypothetical protein
MRRQMMFELIRRATMFGIAAFAFTVAGRPMGAQSPSRLAAPDSAKVLVGTWEGTYTSDHTDPGAMKLVIAKDSVLRATALSLAMGGEMQAVPVHDFVVTSTDISWMLEMMGMSCQATAVLKSGQMKGAIVCGHGQVMFTLSKHS